MTSTQTEAIKQIIEKTTASEGQQPPAGTSTPSTPELNLIFCDRSREEYSYGIKWQEPTAKRVTDSSDRGFIELIGFGPGASTHTQPPPKHAPRRQRQREYRIEDVGMKGSQSHKQSFVDPPTPTSTFSQTSASLSTIKCMSEEGFGGVVQDTTGTPVSEPFAELKAEKKKSGYDGDCQRLIKLVIVGDPGVGKTSLMRRFLYSDYGLNQTTMLYDSGNRYVTLNNKTVKLEVWDTAGMEKNFNLIPASFFRDAEGVIIVFDVTNQKTFTHVYDKWVAVIKQMCETASILLVGHKCDSDDKVRKVEKKAAQRIAKRCGAIDYIEASSTDDINVDQVFYKITHAILKKHPQDPWPRKQPLPQPQQQRKSSCSC